MAGQVSWSRAVGLFSRDARLYLCTAVLNGFTVFGGIYSLLMNLYLLRLGYDTAFIGLVNGASMLGWAVACLPAGAVGRAWGGRVSMVVGMAGAMAGFLLLPLCEVIPAGPGRGVWIMAASLLANIAISLYDVNSQPFLAGASTPVERDHLFSLQAALWPLAGFAGSLVGGVLPALLAGLLHTTTADPAPYRYPLVAAAASLGLAVWALAATGRRPPGAAADRAGPATPAAPSPSIPAAAALTRFSVLLISAVGAVMILQGTGEGAARTFFNVYLDTALRAPTSTIGILAALAQLVAVPAALLMPAAARRWGHRAVFFWGTLGIAGGLLPLALVPTWQGAGIGYMAVIAFVSLTRAAVTVYLMEVTPEDQRTTLSGVYTMAMGLGWSVVAAGGSRLIIGLGYPAFYLAGALLTAASAIGFLAATRGRRTGPARPPAGAVP
jgi:MFS family permease